MSKLHYARVRRARGLPMPLPPKPKARPLGPPVHWVWRGVHIRMRSDVEKAGTWEEFLDALALSDATAVMDTTGIRFDPRWATRGRDAVRKLTPQHEHDAVMRDFRARVRAILDRDRDASLCRFKESREQAYSAAQDVQTNVTRSLISRFFGRAA